MDCSFKHVVLQIPDEDWKCPKCGCGVEYKDDYGDMQDGFVIVVSENYDCELLHEDDELECGKCGYMLSGAEYSRWYGKLKSLVKCPCCNGKGMVTEKKAKKYKEQGKKS